MCPPEEKPISALVFALNAKLICIFGQVLYGIGNIVQWRIVGCIQEERYRSTKAA